MARIVGVFHDQSAVNAVVAQLHFNNITQITIVRPDAAPADAPDVAQQFRRLGIRDAQIREYQTRLAAQRWLLFIMARALELPTVQRALRGGQALDIDVLPESLGPPYLMWCAA